MADDRFKAALEALDRIEDLHDLVPHPRDIATIRAALASSAMPTGQPVAWLDPDFKPGVYYGKGTSPVTTYQTVGWTPLYAAPQPEAREERRV